MRRAPALSTLLLGLIAGGVAACGEAPDPVFDDDLGVQAVAVDEGALAGSFALFTRAIGLIATPFGEQPSGNDDWLLVERTFDPLTRSYAQSTQLCGGDYLPVLETKTVIPDATWQLVPTSTGESVVIDHGAGTFSLKNHLQLWALDGLEDPLTGALPETRADIGDAFLEHVVDLDGDGNVGVTFLAEGIINAELYSAQRKTTALSGVVLSEDRVIGRSDHLYEFIVIEASTSLAEAEPQRNPTDPQQSWYEELRIADGASCDAVQALVDDGSLGDRPF